MSPRVYPSTKNAISSRLSSRPSRLPWMRSTARTAELLLLEALDLGPEVAALLHRHRGRARGIGRRGHAGQDLVHEALVVVLLRLAPRGDLGMAIVVRVVAGPAGHLRHLAVAEAGHVVVEEEPAPRAVVVDDVAEPERPVRHGNFPRRREERA